MRQASFVTGFLFTLLLSSSVLLLLYSVGGVDAEHESAHLLPFRRIGIGSNGIPLGRKRPFAVQNPASSSPLRNRERDRY